MGQPQRFEKRFPNGEEPVAANRGGHNRSDATTTIRDPRSAHTHACANRPDVHAPRPGTGPPTSHGACKSACSPAPDYKGTSGARPAHRPAASRSRSTLATASLTADHATSAGAGASPVAQPLSRDPLGGGRRVPLCRLQHYFQARRSGQSRALAPGADQRHTGLVVAAESGERGGQRATGVSTPERRTGIDAPALAQQGGRLGRPSSSSASAAACAYLCVQVGSGWEPSPWSPMSARATRCRTSREASSPASPAATAAAASSW